MERPTINPDLPSTYLDETLYGLKLVPISWINGKPPKSIERFNFCEIEELKNGSISQFEDAMNGKLQFTILGALKTLLSTPYQNRVIVVDIPSPTVLPYIKLYLSPRGNWHYDIEEPICHENIERANRLHYVYFQDEKYFLALRYSEDRKDIFLFVYKK